jgi:hypothetical protein
MPTTTAELLAALRAKGPTLDICFTADLLNFKRSTFYAAVKAGTAPVRTIRAGTRTKVLTASVAELLGIDLDAPDGSGETTPGPGASRHVECPECGFLFDPARAG